MVDRRKPPDIHQILKFDIPPVDVCHLENKVPVYAINLGQSDVIKLDIIHRNGRWAEIKKITSHATAAMLKEGTKTYSGYDMARRIDSLGASIKTASNMDYTYTTVYCMSKHLSALMPILKEMYSVPTFPEEELQKFKTNQKQKLKEELKKNDVVSYREITAMMYGDEHPYGYNSQVEDYAALNRTDILNYFDHNFGSDNLMIFISGKIYDDHNLILNDYWGKDYKNTSLQPSVIESAPSSTLTRKIISKAEHQTAIKIGKTTFARNHPDFLPLFMVHTVLGGYFGSRLMGRLREDLGLTYDVSSVMESMLRSGYFYITLDTSPEHVRTVQSEVATEIHRLQNESISAQELNMVKNYLKGSILNMLDGPMHFASLVKSSVLNGIGSQHLFHFISHLESITSEEIMECAQKYLIHDSLYSVTVGPE